MERREAWAFSRVRVDEFNDWMNRFRGGTSKDLETVWDQVMREV
jgi:hypothetical protein